MAKKIGRLWFYGVYCILALVGLLADFGVFSGRLRTEPFVYYTSLSNMVCSVFMAISLVRCLQNRDNTGGFAPICKYFFVVMILITAIVYNLLLNPYRSWNAYFTNVKNSLYHLVLPVMFLLDWLLFYRRRSLKLWQPLCALLIPLSYIVYILVRAAVVKAARLSVSVLYPYFFLNVDRLGWLGFLRWMGILLLSLVAMNYGLYALDRIHFKKAVLSGLQ